MSKNEVKFRFNILGGNRFARNEVRVSKTDDFLRVWLVRRQPFHAKRSSSQNGGFLASLVGPVKGSDCVLVCKGVGL